MDMKTTDLSKTLKKYQSGWVAVSEKNTVVAHAKTFAQICKKIDKNPNVLLIPATRNYFGFVTNIDG